MSPRREHPLRIGLNLIFLGERAGGIGRYALELTGALLAAEPENEIHAFVSKDAPEELVRAEWADAVRWVTLPVRLTGPPLHTLAEFLALPPLSLARGLDVLHSPANTGPAITPSVPSVITLHDLIWLHRAAEWEPSRLVQRRMLMQVRHCVRHAERIFTDSAVAADDIADTLGVARKRIDITPLGVRLPEPTEFALGSIRERLGLGNARVLLCVAQKRPYKNQASLVRALGELDEDVKLVLPGAATEYEAELRALAEQLGVIDRVRFPDWLSQAELDALYALSDVFVLPSLIEGFGLPVLEAMARGLPVACSDIPALREVAGQAALMFDPAAQEQVTRALRRLLADHPLAQRLVAEGKRRVGQFSWRRTAEASLAGYRRAIAQRRGGLT